VLIADVDFEYLDSRGSACLTIAVLLVAMIGTLIALAGAGWVAIPQVILIGVSSLVLIPMAVLLVRDWLSKAWVRSQDGFGPLTRHRIDRFLETNPDWAIRIYETPNGMRLIATHRLFEAREAEVERFFEAIVADPVYRRMCRNQNCFRARLLRGRKDSWRSLADSGSDAARAGGMGPRIRSEGDWFRGLPICGFGRIRECPFAGAGGGGAARPAFPGRSAGIGHGLMRQHSR
jgi:hypothetical protein